MAVAAGMREWQSTELHWPAPPHDLASHPTEPSSKSQLHSPTSADLSPPPTEPSPPDQTTLSYWKGNGDAPSPPSANASFGARWSAWQGDPNVRQFEADFSR